MRSRLFPIAGLVALVAAGAIAAGAEPLIRDGGFEDGELWTGEITTDAPHSGRSAVRLDNSKASRWKAVAYKKTLALRPGVPYRLTVWIQRELGDGDVRVGGFPLDAEGQRLRSSRSWNLSVFPIRVTAGRAVGRWTRFDKVFTVSHPDFAGLALRLTHERGRDVVLFDDLSLEPAQLPPAPAFEFPGAVLFPGHPSRFGMRVEEVEETPGSVRVVTSGAEYVFDEEAGTVRATQRIGTRRRVMTLHIAEPLGRLRVTSRDDDACVVEGDGLAFGVQGDSLVALATDRALQLTVTSHIPAPHLAGMGPHLLAVDPDGGFAISHDLDPDHRSPGCEISERSGETDRPGWSFRYRVGARERVGFAVFPPRPFDWRTAFEERVVNVIGIPTRDELRYYGRHSNVLMMFDSGRLYDRSRQPVAGRGPYVPREPRKLRKLVRYAHGRDMKVVVYSNPERELELWFEDDREAAFDHLSAVTREQDLDGWYFDGLFESHRWSVAYSWIRRARDLVGPDGLLYTHCTVNPPMMRDTLYLPFIDTYSDFLLRGEGQSIDGVNDPYMRYVINSHRISNAIPTLKWDGMRDAELRDIFRAMLGFHGRFRWAYPAVPGKKGPRAGPGGRPALDREFLEFYFPELDRLQEQWERGELAGGVRWPLSPAP